MNIEEMGQSTIFTDDNDAGQRALDLGSENGRRLKLK
jgi:hypothetical protein